MWYPLFLPRYIWSLCSWKSLISVLKLFSSIWIESVVPLKVKPGRQRLEKRLLCISQATGNVLLHTYTASWLSTDNKIQRSELRSRFSMESGLFFSLTVFLATWSPRFKENQPVFCQSEERPWLHRVWLGILNSL